VYLTGVIDLFDRKVIGRAVSADREAIPAPPWKWRSKTVSLKQAWCFMRTGAFSLAQNRFVQGLVTAVLLRAGA
jgi:hypothetical protein